MSILPPCRGLLALLSPLSLLLAPPSLAAPSVLEAGDVWVIGYQSRMEPVVVPPAPDSINTDVYENGGKAYSLITWVDLEPGTTIGLTDSGYQGSDLWYGEGSTTWTADQAVPAGSIIRMTFVRSDANPSLTLANTGSVSGVFDEFSIPGISNEGDQLFVYQDGSLNGTGSGRTLTGKLLFGFNADYEHGQGWVDDDFGGSIVRNESKLPSSLQDSDAHIEMVGTKDSSLHAYRNGQYAGPFSGLSIEQYQAAIRDPSNWTFSDAQESINWLDDTSFQIVAEIPEPAVALGAMILTFGFVLPARVRHRRFDGGDTGPAHPDGRGCEPR